MRRLGKFITFEGGEGSGKSTQAVRLCDYLRQKNIPVLLTREPGGSPGAELIRDLFVNGPPKRWNPLTEVLLLCAARIDHWEKVILPALESGKWVICDRFFDSTLAYQGYGHGLNLSFLINLNTTILPSSAPDLTFIFDLDPTIGLKRSLSRINSEDRFEKMDISFHQRLRDGYLQIAQDNPKRCHVIDAFASIDQIFTQVLYHIDPLLLEACTS